MLQNGAYFLGHGAIPVFRQGNERHRTAVGWESVSNANLANRDKDKKICHSYHTDFLVQYQENCHNDDQEREKVKTPPGV